MKNIIVMLIVLVTTMSCAKEKPAAFSKEWVQDRKDQANTLKVGQCYVTKSTHEPEFSFEKRYTYISNIMYVIDVDKGKGALIAQPNPDCKENVEDSYDCEYWFRSMSFDDPFLIDPGTHKTECPTQFTRDNMIKRLKESRESDAFKVGDLQ